MPIKNSSWTNRQSRDVSDRSYATALRKQENVCSGGLSALLSVAFRMAFAYFKPLCLKASGLPLLH